MPNFLFLNFRSWLNTADVLLNPTDNPWGVENFKHKPIHVFHTVGNYLQQQSSPTSSSAHAYEFTF